MGARRQRIQAALNKGLPAAWIKRKLNATLEEIYKVGCAHRWIESPTHPIIRCCLCDKESDIIDRREVGVNTEEMLVRVENHTPGGIPIVRIIWVKPWKRK